MSPVQRPQPRDALANPTRIAVETAYADGHGADNIRGNQDPEPGAEGQWAYADTTNFDTDLNEFIKDNE